MNNLQKKLTELNEGAIATLYRNLFSSVDGQLVLQDLKDRTFINAPLPLGEEGCRAEGMRQVLITIETQINYEPEPMKEDQ